MNADVDDVANASRARRRHRRSIRIFAEDGELCRPARASSRRRRSRRRTRAGVNRTGGARSARSALVEHGEAVVCGAPPGRACVDERETTSLTSRWMRLRSELHSMSKRRSSAPSGGEEQHTRRVHERAGERDALRWPRKLQACGFRAWERDLRISSTRRLRSAAERACAQAVATFSARYGGKSASPEKRVDAARREPSDVGARAR